MPLTTLAARHGLGVRTVQRWHAAYLRDGPAGLDTLPRSDRGCRRLHPQLVALIEGLALLKPPASIASITRRAAAIAGDKGWPPASYPVVYSIVTGLDPGMLTLAHDGAAAYRDRFELVWRRRAERPNAMWQADHTELDIVIRDPAGRPARPWLTAIEDDHSRGICGYLTYLGAPSAMNTALALRQAIWPKPDPGWPMCGIPDVLYVDHGSDFTSHQLDQASHDLHCRIVYSAIARPQGRGKVERFFGSVNTELLADLPGHLAPGARHPQPVLDLHQLDQAIGRFIDVYHQCPHPEIGTSPRQAWLAGGWLPRLPDSIEALNVLLLTVAKPRIVHRDGIHFQGQRYIATTLAAYVGEPVTVRYDPRDITEVRVFHRGQFVCKAVDPDHSGATISLKDIQAARNARRRALRDQIHERLAVVADLGNDDAAGLMSARKTDETDTPARSRLPVYREDR